MQLGRVITRPLRFPGLRSMFADCPRRLERRQDLWEMEEQRNPGSGILRENFSFMLSSDKF